jgi:hypothetical protein
MSFKPKMFLVLAVCLLVCSATYALSINRRISNVGKVKSIGCTVDTDFIDWGLLAPGEVKHHTIRVTLTGDVNATLKLETTDWQPPEAQQYLFLSWNYAGQVLEPETTVIVDLALFVSQSVQNITDFSFTIVITAIEAEG